MILIRRAGVEIEMLVEASGLVIFGVNEDGANACDFRGLQCSGQGIMQESRAQSLAFCRIFDGKAGQQHDRSGMAGQAFRYPGGRLVSDGADSQAVVADYPIVGDGDIGLCAAGRLVVEGEAAKVAIEVFVPAVERIDELGALQFADCPACRAGGSQCLAARRHQVGEARPFARRRVERGLEGVPLSVVENEKAAISQGLGG